MNTTGIVKRTVGATACFTGTRITNAALITTAAPLTMAGPNGADFVGLAMKNDSAGPGSSYDAYFNNITLVPEPASALPVGLLGTFTLSHTTRSKS